MGLIYTIIILVICYLVYLFRYYIYWFFDAVKVSHQNQKGIKDIQKEGMNNRNLSNQDIKLYIEMAVNNLKSINVPINKKYILNQELERHLRYSRFEEKYVLELLRDILNHMGLDVGKIELKVTYLSSKYTMGYAGMYTEKNEKQDEKIEVIIRNDMTMDTVVSILAHECTHHLLLTNGIRLKDRIENECLTDVAAIVMGFGNFMVEGYKISNKVVYDEEFHRSIKKDRVGYLSYKDIKYALKNI